PPFDRPEMFEADLTGLVLDLASWGVADPAQLAFLDPPPKPAWTEARTLLEELGVLDAAGQLTKAGKAGARLPLHPRLAHMVQCAAAEGEAVAAAQLAVLLGERGLGVTDIDLAERLARFRTERGRRSDDARRLAARWARAAGAGADAGGAADAGRQLARAYPDRVAQAAGGRGRYRLANGRAGMMEAGEPLSGEPFLVVTDLTGSAANGRIRAAAAIDRGTIEELFAKQIREETARAFVGSTASVRARRVRRLGALRLGHVAAPVGDDLEVAAMLTAGLAATGLERLPWTREQLALRARSSFLHGRLDPEWPELSDATLAQDGAAWLVPHIGGVA